MVAIRRPQQDVPYAEQINKTLDKAIVLDAEAQYDAKIAETPEQISDLVSKGYTREDEINGKHVYKKRK